jgi:23S rRNA pseudouridine2604 synthase
MDSPLRLSKLMADKGICSRREADVCIENGWVKVNGEIIRELGTKVSPDSTITLSEDAAAWLGGKISIIIYKPVGYVSGQAEDDYEPASFLITDENQVRSPGDSGAPDRKDLMTLAPAGRLDIDSRGLLLLSQDGKLVRKIIAPDAEMEKEYLVWVEGQITPDKLKKLRHGLSLDGKKLKPAIVEQVKPQQLRFILREGKKRQIRRVCEMMELDVTSLVRIRIGPIKLGNLEPSQWRYLSRNEQFSIMKDTSPTRSAEDLDAPPRNFDPKPGVRDSMSRDARPRSSREHERDERPRASERSSRPRPRDEQRTYSRDGRPSRPRSNENGPRARTGDGSSRPRPIANQPQDLRPLRPMDPTSRPRVLTEAERKERRYKQEMRAAGVGPESFSKAMERVTSGKKKKKPFDKSGGKDGFDSKEKKFSEPPPKPRQPRPAFNATAKRKPAGTRTPTTGPKKRERY